MKKTKLLSLLCIIGILLIGCSKENSINGDINKVHFNNDGTVEAEIVETFDKDYYNISELESFIKDTINEYNGVHGKDSIVMKSLEEKDGKAILALTYKTLDDYNAFSETNVSISTLKNAQNEGISLPDVYISAKDGAYASTEIVLQNEDYKVIVVNEGMVVKVDGKIKYFTNGKLINKTSFQANGEEASVIVYKP